MNDNNESPKHRLPDEERRDYTISFRVSLTQRDRIRQLADECGMRVSEYVLARAYGYNPKPRLTSGQSEIRTELIAARADYVRYTSMLNTMSQDERRAMFRNEPWMVKALLLLGKTADRVSAIITRHFSHNKVPSVTVNNPDKDEP